jgi:hypothetical protein
VRGSTLCVGDEWPILNKGKVAHVCTSKNDQNTVHSTHPSARAPKFAERSMPASEIAGEEPSVDMTRYGGGEAAEGFSAHTAVHYLCEGRELPGLLRILSTAAKTGPPLAPRWSESNKL